MVAIRFDDFSASRSFMIRPNRSLSWPDVVRFYLGMVVLSFTIALAFAMKGAWLILPFAGLEMALLGVALYLVARKGTNWQQVLIHGDAIEIAQQDSGRKQYLTFQRAWARVELKASPIKGHPSRLTIGSHGRCVEIGACLNETEKKQLARDLGFALAPL